jgi:hypothetical protein
MQSEALHTRWVEQVPDEQWVVYQRVIAAVQVQRLPFALGVAFALAAYTGIWRNTKDLDLYILPPDRNTIMGLLTQAGLADHYDQEPYDRSWIYRSHQEEVIVDAIWAMANGRAGGWALVHTQPDRTAAGGAAANSAGGGVDLGQAVRVPP